MTPERYYHSVTPPSRDRHPIPPHANLREAFMQSAIGSIYHLGAIYGMDQAVGLSPFMEGLATRNVVVFAGTNTYDQHMEAAGKNAYQPPFGIELNTLSPNVQLVLYPRVMFEATEKDRKFAQEEGIEVKEIEKQAMVYVLDGFKTEAPNAVNQAANLIFLSHMVDALVEGRYPIERDNQSQEFVDQVKGGMEAVRKYVSDLTPEQRAQLLPFGRRIAEVGDDQLPEFARAYAARQVEQMKLPGLAVSEDFFMEPDDPEGSVTRGEDYLHISERNLPQRASKEKGVPVVPWRECGRNRWNRSHQLFGRYETDIDDGRLLRVDFRFDSTHMPAKYGFFDTIEVAVSEDGAITDHIILGQEVNHEQEERLLAEAFSGKTNIDAVLQQSLGIVYPIVVAGNFDFKNSEIRDRLVQLTNDKGTKPEVSRVMADVLRLDNAGILPHLKADNSSK